ncbi:hypothetical protein VOLCADRAFT_88171 [Volvox carteri f. nagariensis]|uniref:Uncharacterized protein n=1 Tax=Volvox carteri f. nagariensis TaxID=3068 RepID=D8TNG6_VOLCA|nr:uncharacterized protein VOLCADRAFT_88171 [Volvox carteri f. nagariensis]EFJ50990.1 hypothetical protein VOLCADRAFT_88171 [Volvox carteri f. nagariensis]|eukprot:XP_002948002.1 hypothetical protein VOLCADRAFT_88171 [Volvox carteri f. nagariensis]
MTVTLQPHFAQDRRPQRLLVALIACFILQLYDADAAARQLSGQEGGALYRAGFQNGNIGGPARRLLRVSDRSLEEERSQPALAAAYMDSLLADPVAARARLVGDFTKRSKVAVIYMCFERMEMIHRAVPAILRSEGLAEFDLFISQDGGAASIFENGTVSRDAPFVYIRHPANLCTGLHHYFVKAFAFDIMGYDILLIVEEDNVVHPQALQLLRRMAQLSVAEQDIGIVSLLDLDMSPFLDAERFAEGLIQTVGHMGHLWVFGLHRAKYNAVRACLRDYYEVIKGHDYRVKHLPPLRDAIQGLMKEEGFPVTTELSQDRWFINSLSKFGFTKRYQTLFRFFEPIGSYGLHFHMNESLFYEMFGRGMYGGRIDPNAAFDVTKDPADGDAIKATVQERLTALFNKHWAGAAPPPDLMNTTYHGILEGRLNGLEVVRDIMRGPHH